MIGEKPEVQNNDAERTGGGDLAEGVFEKERTPERVFLFVRHPSVQWLDRILEEAEEKGEDVETYVPIDRAGLKMTRQLSDYFQEHLADFFRTRPEFQKHERQRVSIYTSSIKRARDLATIITRNLKLNALENQDAPVPISGKPVELEFFAEAPLLVMTKQEAQELLARSRAMGREILEFLFEQDPDRVVNRLEEQRKKIEEGLEYLLRRSKTPLAIVFAHKFVIALVVWLAQQKKAGRENLEFTQEDFPRLLEITKLVAHTSITELASIRNELEVKSMPAIPHRVE